MDYSKISIKIKKGEYYELIQTGVLEYARDISRSIDKNNIHLEILIKLEILSKLNLRLRTIIEKNKRPKSMLFSVQEASILILINRYRSRPVASLENAVLQTISDDFVQVLISRFM